MAEIEIEHEESNALETSLGANTAAGTVPDDAKVQVQTEVTILQSEDLALETIEKTNYEQHEGIKRKPEENGLPLAEAPVIRKKLLQKFSGQLSVAPHEGTRLIEVSFTDRDPKFAASTVMALLNQYIQDRLRRRNSSTMQATDWIGAQITDINKRLEDSQKALADYQKQSGLVSLPSAVTSGTGTGGAGGATVRSPAVDRLLQLNQSLVTVQTDRISKEAIYRTVQSGNPDKIASIAASQLVNNTSQDPTQAAMFTGLMNLRQQQNVLRVQLASANQIYGPKNPHLLDLNRQMQELDRQIQDEVKAIVSRTNLDYMTALKNESGIHAAYNRALQESGEAGGKEGHLSVLQQEADSAKTLYEDLYTKLAQAKLSVGTQASNVSLISKAMIPSQAVYPKPVLYCLISILAGAFIGVAIAFLIESADDSVVTNTEVEDLTDFPVLASIPQVGSTRTSKKNRKGISLTDEEIRVGSSVIRNPQSAAAEAFRVLRTNLIATWQLAPNQSLLVVSPLAAEGRTSVAYNLGCSLSMTGDKVLLIDGDLRNPNLHSFAGIENLRGLSTWLSSEGSLQQLIVPSPSVPNLAILPAGPEISHPSDQLQSSRMDELLQAVSGSFKFVLIDSSPFMFVSDASAIARKVGGVLIVVESGDTTELALKRMAQQLRRLRVTVLGVALNRVNTSSSEYYYSQGFRGSDGKGYHVND